jgi:Alr-MurF fusion protein
MLNILDSKIFPISIEAAKVLTDSRQFIDGEKTIFFAIKGERNDGHQYIYELYLKGIRNFVVETESLDLVLNQLKGTEDESIKIWKTSNAILELQDFASKHRSKFSIPVVGITGSNGKTIIKEWLAEILSIEKVVVKSPKSYNSQIGVPLSVLKMNKTDEVAVFEAGVSKTNEMAKLEKIIQPTIGIFTNIGSAHDEGFKTIKQKISEKIQLFKKAKYLIYNTDNQELDKEIRIILKSINPKIILCPWEINDTVFISKEANQTKIELGFNGLDFVFYAPFIDDISIQNIIHVIYSCLILGIKTENIQKGLSKILPLEMRMSIKKGIKNSILIDDTYNNDFVGLESALDFMNQKSENRFKTLIISEMYQTGLSKKDFNESIFKLVSKYKIDLAVFVGQQFEKQCFQNTVFKTIFYDNEINVSEITNQIPQNAIMLIKGARHFKFEKIVNQFSEQSHQTVLEINLNSLTKNLNFYKKTIGNETKIMAMVKAFAYGSGSVEVAELLQFNKVDYLAVAYIDEGVKLRQNGIHLPIMVMNPNCDDMHNIVEYNLEPEVYSFEMLNELIANSSRIENLKIHVKLDTGMHRLGFLNHEIEELIAVLKLSSKLKIASIFSHLSSADGKEHDEFTKNQIKIFGEMAQKIKDSLAINPILHLSNSAGVLSYPSAKFDMIRLGIGLYGFDSSSENHVLETVTTLKSVVSQVKFLAKNTSVGYSRKGHLEHDSIIATIPIGYADGYDRRFGNGNGYVLINGIECKTVGNICMDMMMVDATNANTKRNDEVIIFGEKPNIKALANQIGTIPYEILTGVSERVKRIFFKN